MAKVYISIDGVSNADADDMERVIETHLKAQSIVYDEVLTEDIDYDEDED